MRIASRLGVAIAAVILAAMPAACGEAASEVGDDSIKLPERAAQDSGKEAAVGDGGPRPTDAAVQADTSAARRLCGEPDLLLCFSFEGEVKDGSPNAFAPTTTQGVTFAPGKVGQAVVLGNTSFIRYASAPLLTAPVTTVEAWVRPAQVLAEGVIFDADERYAMSALPDGSLQCNTANVVVKGGVLPIGVWTHVACVYDGAKVQAYVGGVLANSGAGSNGTSPIAPASIGGNAPTGLPFVGAIDSFRVFKAARSAAQIAAAASGN